MSESITFPVTVSTARGKQDVAVRCHPDTAMSEVLRALWEHVGEAASDMPPAFAGAVPLNPKAPLSICGLRPGDAVSFGAPLEHRRGQVSTALELAVVGGLSAGPRHPVDDREITVGRGDEVRFSLEDPEASRGPKVSILPTTAGFTAENRGSSNPVRVAGRPVPEREQLLEGELLQIGQSLLCLRSSTRPDAHLEDRAGSASRFVNRPPRLRPPNVPPVLSAPAQPTYRDKPRLSVAALLLPAVLGGVLAYIQKNLIFLLFALGGPVLAGANVLSDLRSIRRAKRVGDARYEEASQAFSVQLDAALRAEERMRREDHPDPAAVVATAEGPGRRLWERNVDDDDFLVLRLGLADQPAYLEVQGWAPASVTAVPVTVELADAETGGVLGIAGPRRERAAVARALFCQAAVLHPPQQLHMALLVPGADPSAWDWAKWTPHLRQDTAELNLAVATSEADTRRLLATLLELARRRDEAARSRHGDEGPASPVHLVLLEGSGQLLKDPALHELTRLGPHVGIFMVCLDDDERRLPNACRAIARLSDQGAGIKLELRRHDQTIADVHPDGLTLERAEAATRALAALEEVEPGGEDGVSLPGLVSHLDLLRLPEPDAASLIDRWDAAQPQRCQATIGLAATGPFTIDLDRDGPHAVIAGMTGAGKSVLLQALVLGLALEQPPEHLNFLLVDFKGGAAFEAFRSLPHQVGMVSDLEAGLVERMLRSLQAEIDHRKRTLAAGSARDIHHYWAMARHRPDMPVLPRLVVVVDELAELDDEFRDSRQRLVQIGRVGRSLGVHLVLATQSPEGVISEQLRQNTNLWLCLRVRKEQDSLSVIGSPEAAGIAGSAKGRAYARVGSDPLVAFQTAVLEVPDATGATETVTVREFALARRLGAQQQDDLRESSAPDDKPDRLGTLLAAIVSAQELRSGARARQPWLPPLPDVLLLRDLPRDAGAAGPAWGLRDLPEKQSQPPLVLDFASTPHLLIVGPPRSGRTSALLALAVATGQSSGSAQIYGLDFAAQQLTVLEGLPHCGGVVSGDDRESVRRFLQFLTSSIVQRQISDESRPDVLVLLDSYDSFHERSMDEDSGELVELLDQLLRIGPGQGIHFAITAGQKGSVRLGGIIPHRLVLRPTTREDAGAFGLPSSSVMPGARQGRGVWTPDLSEAQVALVAQDPAWAAQSSAIRALSQSLPPVASPPALVEPLPVQAAWTNTPRNGSGRDDVAFAVGGVPLGPVPVSLAALGGSFVVAGRQGSGKSTALLAVLAALEGTPVGDSRLLLLSPRPSALRGYARWRGACRTIDNLPEIEQQLPAMLESEDRPTVLVIDDADLLADPALSASLEAYVRDAQGRQALFLAAGDLTRMEMRQYGWLHDARQQETGLLLRPRAAADGRVLYLNLPRGIGGPNEPPGRGILAVRGETQAVQVMLPPGL